MRKKGRTKSENPEKMSAVTCGIQMTRGDTGSPKRREHLTGGNQPADEAMSAKLVTDFILNRKPEK
jgi:hypothetical protein